jgi:hypothetical protein
MLQATRCIELWFAYCFLYSVYRDVSKKPTQFRVYFLAICEQKLFILQKIRCVWDRDYSVTEKTSMNFLTRI